MTNSLLLLTLALLSTTVLSNPIPSPIPVSPLVSHAHSSAGGGSHASSGSSGPRALPALEGPPVLERLPTFQRPPPLQRPQERQYIYQPPAQRPVRPVARLAPPAPTPFGARRLQQPFATVSPFAREPRPKRPTRTVAAAPAKKPETGHSGSADDRKISAEAKAGNAFAQHLVDEEKAKSHEGLKKEAKEGNVFAKKPTKEQKPKSQTKEMMGKLKFWKKGN